MSSPSSRFAVSGYLPIMKALKFSDKDFPTLDDFLKFLKDHCKSLDAAQGSSPASTHTTSRQTDLRSTSTSKPNKYSKSDKKCGKKHHTSLHEDNFLKTNSTFDQNKSPRPNLDSTLQPETHKETSVSQVSFVHHTNAPTPCVTTLLGTALIQLRDSTNNFQTFRALIDPGSMSCFITDHCVKKLGLPRSKLEQHVLGISQTAATSTKGKVSCILKPTKAHTPLIPTTAIVLNKITSPLPSVRLTKDIINHFKDWNLADPHFYEPSPVDFLIGADLFPLICDGGRSNSPPGFPTPFKTIYGWTLIGRTCLSYFENQPTCSSICTNLSITESSLEKHLKLFWELEDLPQSKPISPEDQACERIFVKTHSRDPSGRYIVRLPFCENPVDLGNTFHHAERNFHALERRFQSDFNFKSAYVNFMKEYEDLGHMTQLHSSTSTTSTYVIPHHGVFKNSEQNPKLRVVFNASARSSNGFSLNDKLLTGKKLQNDVSEILTRFRLHPFVISSDICKMYRQILIHPEDRIFQTILWRENQNSPLATYALNTVTYGVSSSPFLAIRTLHQLVADEGADFPLASKAILNDMFVDDCLTGNDSLDEAFKLKSELIELLKRGGFELSKWASNSRELLEDIVSKSQDILFSGDKDHNQFIKVLGLKWNQNTDEFTYEVPIQKTLPTKRGILSMISRIFDPLGLVTPVVLWAKCMMQQIWFLGLDWDEILPDDLFTQSKNFFHDLPLLSKLRIPRNVLPQNSTGAQLHGFSDASEVGYGCSVYLRVVTSDGSVMTNLLMAKSKIAPLKKISIPKLELCGALLLTSVSKVNPNVISEASSVLATEEDTWGTPLHYKFKGLEHIEHAYAQQLATGSGFYIWPDLVLRVNLARWRARPTILQDILYLLGAAGPKIRWNFRAPEWDIIEKATCIQQPTGSVDCGVYVCLYTEQIATGTSVTDLGALDGVALRKRMASALRRSELIGDEEQLLIKD
ncbi:uncharacterized protein LOC128984510 [Macrosteles quadrilineatus]|uniref:uncharacterized protein LOC128984510 n=1 Tax=Macrosteles quadrilineatus TaxID=74068 RepID=UPI0023E11E56|nr:uncharacterized protein LOC128984510 [Macrosteles quadrilineatus]